MKKRLFAVLITTLFIFSLSSCKIVVETDVPAELISTTQAGFDYISAASRLSEISGLSVTPGFLENMGDDGTNQHSYHARLAGVVDNGDGTSTVTYKGNLTINNYNTTADKSKLSITRRCQDFRVGDRVYIYTSAGQLVCDSFALQQIGAGDAAIVQQNGGEESDSLPIEICADVFQQNDFLPSWILLLLLYQKTGELQVTFRKREAERNFFEFCSQSFFCVFVQIQCFFIQTS